MADLRVASRYVKSLLGLAVEQGVLEEVHKDMLSFVVICKESRAFIMDILTRKNREPLLLPIAKEFHNAYNEYKGISKAFITTTIPIDKGLRTEIEKIVKKLSDKKVVELDEKVDKSLIGGFILNVGDRQIDASIKSKLEKLKLGFSENPYIKEF